MRFVAILPLIVIIFVAKESHVDRTVDKTVMCNSTAVVFDIARVQSYGRYSHDRWKVYYLYQVRGLNYVGSDLETRKPNIKVGDNIRIQYSDKTPRYSVTLEI